MKKISDQYSIAQARNHFAKIVHEVENGQPVQITRRGKPVVIVLSLDAYERLSSKKLEFGADLDQFRQKNAIKTLDIEPNLVFEDVRECLTGREINF